MGNKLGRRKQVVEDKYTKPQGLYEIKDVDYKKLRKLILDSKLAPCYPGGDDDDDDNFDSVTCLPLEECPICFLYYPTLNRSRCCTKSICTECFLQIKNPSSTRPTQCPFCKTSNYAVEYRGVKSKEQKGMEQIEEQKVIEAKIRMQRQQNQEEEERQQRKEEISSFRRSSMTRNPSYGVSGVIEHLDVAPSQDSSSMQMLWQVPNTGQYRDEEFDVDLEDIMVMEAIWLSIQENGRAGQSSSTNAATDPTTSRDHHVSQPELPSSSRTSKRVKKNQHNRPNISNNFEHEDISPPQPSYIRRHSMRVENIEFDHRSMIAESGTAYASSDDSDMGIESTALAPPPRSTRDESDEEDGEDSFGVMPPPYGGDGGGFWNGLISTPVNSEGFDEQMMLAMAVSIAETTAQGVAWP